MRNLMFVLALVAASCVVAGAQDTTATQPGRDQYGNRQSQQDQSMNGDQNMGKEMIEPSQLPQAITDQLQGQNYTGWTISEATRRMRGDEMVYDVELTSGDQVKKMRFDEQGNVLKEKTKRKKHD